MKLKISDQPYELFSPKKAELKAKELNDSDEWTYKVVHCPKGTGYSYIEIYDENGEFISKL